MAGTNEYTNYPAQFQGGATWNLRQVGSGSWSGGQAEDAVIPAGLHRRDAVITASAMPMLSFDSTDLTTILTNITDISTGYACTSGAEIYYQQRSLGAKFESGSAHLKLESTLGQLLLDSISASGNNPAQASLTYHDLYDGSTNPSVPTASSALGATTPAFVSQFYRGAVTVNGTAVDGITDVSVDFGLQVSKPIYCGDFFPRTISIVSVTPIITVTTDDLAEWPSKITNAYGATYTNTIVYFRRGAAGGTRGGSGTALSITSSAGQMTAREIRGGGAGNSSLQIVFMPTTDLSFSLSATHP